jgi:hypothetical protein
LDIAQLAMQRHSKKDTFSSDSHVLSESILTAHKSKPSPKDLHNSHLQQTRDRDLCDRTVYLGIWSICSRNGFHSRSRPNRISGDLPKPCVVSFRIAATVRESLGYHSLIDSLFADNTCTSPKPVIQSSVNVEHQFPRRGC